MERHRTTHCCDVWNLPEAAGNSPVDPIPPRKLTDWSELAPDAPVALFCAQKAPRTKILPIIASVGRICVVPQGGPMADAVAIARTFEKIRIRGNHRTVRDDDYAMRGDQWWQSNPLDQTAPRFLRTQPLISIAQAGDERCDPPAMACRYRRMEDDGF